MTIVEILFLVVLLVVFPVRSARGFPEALRAIAEGRPDARTSGFRETIRWQWGLLAAALVIWFLGGRTPAELGFTGPEGWGFWICAGLSVAAAGGLTAQLRQARREETARYELRTQLGGNLAFLPRRRHEVPLFNVLCVTAGVCEEILYRGWLLAVVGAWIGVPAAAAFGVVAFGAAHLYGGKSVAIRAGLLGLFFTVLYLVSGSLWIPIVVHAFVDWNMGALSVAAFEGAGDEPADGRSAGTGAEGAE